MHTAGLPGADLIEQGLEDLRGGLETEAALLVSMGAPVLPLRRRFFRGNDNGPVRFRTPGRDLSRENRAGLN